MFFRNSKDQSKKRQWGTETNMTPLGMLHEKPSTRKIALNRIAIISTVFFWLVYIFSIIIRQLMDGLANYSFTMEAASYALVVTFLTFSALVYLITRQGALERFSKHIRVPKAKLDKYFHNHQPGITVLIPSYNEEVSVIRKTILSAALQEYPHIRIVLLVDDKPVANNPKLEATRQIGQEIEALLAKPLSRFTKALAKFHQSQGKHSRVTNQTIRDLALHYQWAANWLKSQSNQTTIEDHVDVFFVQQVYEALAKDLELIASALAMSLRSKEHITPERVEQLFQRLVWIFQTEVEVFERKAYASLSHEANKAMNLNSYISLMGKSFRKHTTPDGIILVPTKNKHSADLVVPDSEYLLTLDADSVLLREYCLRLVYFLEQPENTHVAVTQTPYSSFRGAYSRIERLAGATTDIQHILHQGMSHYGATFWVGANAVIRKQALEDIVETELERGFTIYRYIQDRTVIEDTESSIDLALHGWSLVNYPERLSYSATPPDFGSLVVQRRRWANGGLLILPKLMSVIQRRKHTSNPASKYEIIIRLNYMASIAWATIGLIFLLAYPYDGRLLSPLVLLAALPYFLAMGSDLKYSGYKYSDILRIYGFNLILLPVNLAGVLKSIEQALTGQKIPFARTPKVKDRTPSSLTYVLVPLLIVAFSLFTVWRNVETQNWGNAVFALFNAFLASWAIVAYIGLGNLFADIWLGLTDWLYVEPKAPRKQLSQPQTPQWKSVLYHGHADGIVPHYELTN